MKTMTGVVWTDGEPLVRHDLTRPEPGPGEVLVQVTHATVNGHEIEVAESAFLRLVGRAMGARGEVVTGLEFAGVVRSSGETYVPGDPVLGYVNMTRGWRPHGAFIAIAEAQLARRPAQLSAVDASALSMSGQTALVALRDIAGVSAGDSVMVLGASGGVGVLAVQIARILGARVTAVAKETHHALLSRLGAHTVMDSADLDLARLRGKHALILDMTTTHRYRHVRHLLSDDGCFIPANPLNCLLDVATRRQVRYLWVDKGHAAKLEELAAWAASGSLEMVIDAVYSMGEVAPAFERARARGKAGRVVLEISAPGPEPLRADSLRGGATRAT